eukprot:scaffold18369_cov111-Isochrysis_galbana.AAC.1
MDPGSGTNSRKSQAQTPRGVTVGTLKRGPPLRSTKPGHPPQPCIPEIIGRAPGEKVLKGGGGKGGDASPPEDSV